jgi:myosin heavy subunit
MSNTYDVGTKAWQPDSTEGWVASEVTAKQIDGDKVTLVFALANGEVSGHSLWNTICPQRRDRKDVTK